MPNPKRRSSSTHRDKRRTHYKATASTMNKCTNCGAEALRHRACKTCGYYRGRVIVAQKAEKATK